ncbi:germin-like protein 9-3 [Castanea sativa]|uniref:germin-like protein 9-3 n=1 Tax=Castanea sativa TaxID=21020 RepID=UPI003F651EF7
MASKTSTMKFFTRLISSSAIIQMARAGDPDILSDFIVPPNVTTVDASFFTFTGMRFLAPTTTFKVSKISLAEFPALNGQCTLQVGFVDTTNKLFTQTLKAGDIFVFPKGLVHFQYNSDTQIPALAVSSFGSANAGTVSLPNTLFTTGIDDNILAKSFKTDILYPKLWTCIFGLLK